MTGASDGLGSDPMDVVRRLHGAINDHDLEALTACFDPDSRNVTPAHPERSFRGREQVRRNWLHIFEGVPDVRADLVRCTRDSTAGNTVWAEWEWTGTRTDGSPMLMRGVTLFGIAEDRVCWLRFYMEPVQLDGIRIDAAVARVTGGDGNRTAPGPRRGGRRGG
jgi:ketosteroid isomerase-like protein